MTDVSATTGVRRWTGGDIWARYLARGLDALFLGWIPVLVIGMGAGVVIGVLHPEWFDSPDYELVAGAVFIAVYVLLRMVLEAWMLAAFGRTPGKALMGVSVRRADGERAGFWAVLWRQVLIAFYGYGLFIPVVSLVTMLTSYSRLGDVRRTKWDELLKLESQRKKVGWLRYGFGLVLWVLVMFATIMLNALT